MTLSWRERRALREGGVEITLPSGMMARLRAVGLDAFLLTGQIPDALTPAILEAVEGGSADLPAMESLSAARDYLHLLNAVCAAAFVSPRVVESPQADDEIALDDIDFEDKVWLLELLGKPITALLRFRPAAELPTGVGDLHTPEGDFAPGI
jgi:hypothetical protein